MNEINGRTLLLFDHHVVLVSDVLMEDSRLKISSVKETNKQIKKKNKNRDKKKSKIKGKKKRKQQQAEFICNFITESKRKERAIDYLHLFNQNKSNWKFNKKQQIWLLKNWNNQDNIDDNDFNILLQYIVGLESKSLSKKRLSEEVEQEIKLFEQNSDEKDEKQTLIYERARQIMQCLT